MSLNHPSLTVRRIAILCGIIISMGDAVVSGINEQHESILSNPGFENGITGWTVDLPNDAEGTVRVGQEKHCSGDAALHVRKTNGLGGIRIASANSLVVKTGVEYRFQAFYHADELPPVGCRISLQLSACAQDGREVATAASGSFCSMPTLSREEEWTPVMLWFTPPPGVETVKLRIVVSGNPCNVWLDDVSFQPYDAEAEKKSVPSMKPGDGISWEETLKILETRPESTATMRRIDGTPRLCVDGNPTPPVFLRMRGKRGYGFCREFADAGVDMQMVIVPVGGWYPEVWKGPGQYDFEPLDARLRFALQRNPHGYLVVAVGTGPYTGWENEHPQECVQDGNGLFAMGSVDREYFAKAGEARDPKHHPIFSYHSRLLREQMSETLVATLEFLKKQPYYKAVVGFSIAGGHDAQWRTNTVVGENLEDYSPAALAAFRDFMRNKYQTVHTLREALDLKSAEFETLAIPTMKARTAGTFRDPRADRLLVDYGEFLATGAADMIVGYARTIRERAGKPVFVAAYYQDVLRGIGRNYDAMRRIQEARVLDLVHAPTGYAPRNQPGAPGNLCPLAVGSLSLRDMIWVEEFDQRTWVCPAFDPKTILPLGYAADAAAFRAMHRRSLGNSIAQGQGLYYYDMTGGFFNHPYIMADIRQCQTIHRKLLSTRTPSRFRPDVAVIVDEGSAPWVAENPTALGAANACLAETQDALDLSGTPFDVFHFDDLLRYPHLCDYPVYLFLNVFHLQAEQRAFLDRTLKRNGKTLIWMYAAGYVDESSVSPDNISRLVGMRIQTNPTLWEADPVVAVEPRHALTANVPPCLGNVLSQKFWVDDPAAQPFARYAKSGEIAGAMREMDGWRTIYMAAPGCLSPGLIRNIAKQAGAYVCAEADLPVWVNEQFLSIHGTQGGKQRLHLPRRCAKIRDAFTGEIMAEDASTIELDIPLKETRWLLFE